MFNTYIRQDYSKGLSEMSSRISSQMQLDRKSREDIAQKEIKARDRVDISLDEYEKMKSEISSLRWQVSQMNNKLMQFNEVIELNIVPDTMITLYDYDPLNMKSKCRIEFNFIPECGKSYC